MLSLQRYLFGIILLFLWSVVIGNANDKAKVLVLNSYHKGYMWSDDITRGIEETLKDKNVDIHVEYLDTKRHFDQEYLDHLSHLLSIKAQDNKYELVITSDDNAFNYAIKNREKLYGNIPIVFCGVNYFKAEIINGIEKVTGISEVADIEKNISLIKQLHPQCKKIIVLTDNTTSGKHIQNKVLQVIDSDISETIEIELLYDLSIPELIDEMKNLSKNTVVLFTFFFQDKNGIFIEYDQGARIVCENSSVPVYGNWDFSFGYGIIGGYLTVGYDQGARAAKTALRILSGEQIENIPIEYAPKSKLQFDYHALKRFGIAEKKLPADSEVYFGPISFFETYKKQIYLGSVLFIILIVFVVGLSFALRRATYMKSELAKNQTQLQSLLTNIPGAAYRCHIENNWQIKYINENIRKITGYAPARFIDSTITTYRELIHPDDLKTYENTLNCALKANTSWRMTYRILHKNGEHRWIEESGRAVKNEEGKYLFADGIILNVTNEKIAELKLKESEEKHRLLSQELETIIDRIPGIVFKKDDQNNYLYGNKYLADSYNLTKDDLVNKSLFELYPEESAKKYWEDDIKVINSKQPLLDYEETIETQDGTKWLLTNKLPYSDEKTQVSGVIGIGIDITSRKIFEVQLQNKNKEYESINEQLIARNKQLKLVEEELNNHKTNLENLVQVRTNEIINLNDLLKESNTELLATNDMLVSQKLELEKLIEELKNTQLKLIQSEKMASIGILTAGIAHEINNPVNFINSGLTGMEIIFKDISVLLELCEQRTDINTDFSISKTLENIPKLIKSMRNGIFRTTEIVKGLRTFSRLDSETKVQADIHELINSSLIILKNRYKDRIELIKKFDSIPLIMCFPGKLSQVILNILMNAIQSIPEKGTIEITTQIVTKNILTIAIRDSGKGIPDEVKNKIFDPFFTTKQVGEGTGLGLSIVHGIMQEHDGKISFNSSKERGTEFILSLPIR